MCNVCNVCNALTCMSKHYCTVCNALQTLLLATRYFHTFTLSHIFVCWTTFEKFLPHFWAKIPHSYPFYTYFRPQKCRFFVGLKCKKWGARGDNNNLYICINFFLAFRYSKSVKVWKCESGPIFFTFFIFYREKFANTIIRIVPLQRNSKSSHAHHTFIALPSHTRARVIHE